MNISKFTDLVEIISGGTPNTHIKEYWSGNISWLSIADFKNVNKYVLKTEKKITSLGLEQSSTKILNKNSIIISARGTVGALAMLAMPMTFNQSCLGLTTKNNSVIINEYIYYYLKNYIKILKYKKEGSVFGTIDTSTFENINLKYPNTKIQYQITSTLSVIDSLIDNNNNIYSELEKMAKTLYDYWFVQFDFPDENGRPYKSSGGKMVWNNELKKEIPYDWEVKKLKDLVLINKNKSQPDCNKFLLDLSVMPSNSFCLQQFSKGDKLSTNIFTMQKFDILFGSIRPYLLKAGFAPTNGLVAGTIHSVKPIDSNLYNYLLLTFCSNSLFNYAIQNSKGSRMPVIGIDDLLDYKIALNKNIMYKFEKSISFKEIIANIIMENQELILLRDFLLPLLMNGQAVIKE